MRYRGRLVDVVLVERFLLVDRLAGGDSLHEKEKYPPEQAVGDISDPEREEEVLEVEGHAEHDRDHQQKAGEPLPGPEADLGPDRVWNRADHQEAEEPHQTEHDLLPRQV